MLRSAFVACASAAVGGLLLHGAIAGPRIGAVALAAGATDVASRVARSAAPGDVVFRASSSAEGRLVVVLDGSGFRYSHVGIVVSDGVDPIVVHAAPMNGPSGGSVIRESLSAFLSHDDVTAVALYRPDDAAAGHAVSAVRLAEGMVSAAVTFDDDFDLESNDRVYCTELVWKAYSRGGVDLTEGAWRGSALPLSHRPYISPRMLLSGSHLRFVGEWLVQKENRNVE